MKVYVAKRIYNHEGFDIIGIFIDRYDAQTAIDNDTCENIGPLGDDHDVDEFELA